MENIKVKPEIMHLMILERCDHHCRLCCNKHYDINKIPVATVEELETVHTVCITGGEPFLSWVNIDNLAVDIKLQYHNVNNIYIYTSGFAFAARQDQHFGYVDGINFAPKNSNDWGALEAFVNDASSSEQIANVARLKSNRLYVFKEQEKAFRERHAHISEKLNLNVIYRMWAEEFKTPDNEIFRRLPIFLG